MLVTDERQAQAGFTVAMFFFLFALFGRYRRFYRITSQRVTTRIGIVANNSSELNLEHIRTINIRQNIVERLLGTGDLVMASAANGNSRIVFRGVKDPEKIKELIDSARGLI